MSDIPVLERSMYTRDVTAALLTVANGDTPLVINVSSSAMSAGIATSSRIFSALVPLASQEQT
eukprot:CAMPEP_0204038660 /NCGR_PEP_ID=MMETSP0360-20130528/88282_1 /ASSEMBLY_ACC=CAM_ASM_000342 /TAXON_ID=268821 /ORGANISM="Scrippsiella Hangoei, Strain SHTV-5" /LENGTH=62 /DNA_ID=CAMNT_0050984391 /DNA_START=15 /DNA_END=203 /DNA_ORIENTATION=-